MTSRNPEWTFARNELAAALADLGFAEELGDQIARHLGSPKAIQRMTAYLLRAKPADVELVVDEMLAIKAEIDAWRERKPPRRPTPTITTCFTTVSTTIRTAARTMMRKLKPRKPRKPRKLRLPLLSRPTDPWCGILLAIGLKNENVIAILQKMSDGQPSCSSLRGIFWPSA